MSTLFTLTIRVSTYSRWADINMVVTLLRSVVSVLNVTLFTRSWCDERLSCNRSDYIVSKLNDYTRVGGRRFEGRQSGTTSP